MPYNTGNTSWVYNDNMNSPLIKKWLNDTVNADNLNRSDKWLCMMYPRLKLLRELFIHLLILSLMLYKDDYMPKLKDCIGKLR